mmetsp:Transcript_15658/g.34881  ORF Transcript_15658/g.34881 Transcript_15658/m.34881 type:complete len:358 (-) Transcript_15658:22-1095(-)
MKAKLVHGEEPVTVLVEGKEDVPGRRDLVLTQHACHENERSPLQPVERAEAAEPVNDVLLQVNLFHHGHIGRKPLVAQRLLPSAAIFRLPHEQHSDQVHGVFRDIPPGTCTEAELTLAGCHFGVLEGELPTQEMEHKHSAAPKVAEICVFLLYHLRRHMTLCADHFCHDLLRPKEAGQTKVRHLQAVLFHRRLGRQQAIRRLEVPMDDALLVQIANSSKNLLHRDGSIQLGEKILLFHEILESASCAELQYHEEARGVLKDLIHFEDVRMIHSIHRIDLVLQDTYVMLHRLLQDLLHSTHGTCGPEFSSAHGAEVAGTQEVGHDTVAALDVVEVADDHLQGHRCLHTHGFHDEELTP